MGGAGPPLLLVHGWPETWYAWRFVMPVLAKDFTVIAPDQRGIGMSEKPMDGYYPDRVERLIVSEAPIPGVSPRLGCSFLRSSTHGSGISCSTSFPR
jgi:hypothetical protein